MVHGHPVKYRAKNLAAACHGFLRKFLELIVHRAAVLTVRIHLPPADSPSLAGLLLPVSKSRQLPRRARARPGGTADRDAHGSSISRQAPRISLSGVFR